MFRTRDRFTGILFVAMAIAIPGNLALAGAAHGQAAPAELPADCSAYSKVPLPADAADAPVPTTYPSCASYRSYRGIGRPVNYSAARACAWRERLAQAAGLPQNPQEPTAWIVGGSLILADIYFNGAGVRRNIPLAMRFACEAEDQLAMLALPDIEKLNGSPHRDGPFEFCDFAATTITMNFCSAYESEIDDDRRARFYDSLKSSMTAKQREAFEQLLAAEHAYIQAHADEVDQGGTIRGLRTIGSGNILENLFHTELIRFERKERPRVSANQVQSADALLNREIQKKSKQLQSQTSEQIEEGAVTADHLSKVEAAWERYRDAWLSFARLRYPAEVALIRAEITLDRYRLVKTIG